MPRPYFFKSDQARVINTYFMRWKDLLAEKFRDIVPTHDQITAFLDDVRDEVRPIGQIRSDFLSWLAAYE